MIAEAIIDEAVEEFERVLAPPPRPRSLVEFLGTLRLPDDPTDPEREGPPRSYDVTSHPAQFEVAKAFARGGFYDMVVLGPVQDGKTWIVEVALVLYVWLELRRHVVYGCPDRPFCGKMWRSKFMPAIEASGLAKHLPEDGPGSDGGVPDDILSKLGSRLFLLGAGARNEAGQAGVTAPVVVIGERSSIRARWVELLMARKEAYGPHGRGVSTSTLKSDEEGADSTVNAYKTSTAGRLHFACPKCRAWQTWEWKQVEADWSNDQAAESTARIHCGQCRHGLDDQERRDSLRDWRLVMAGQSIGADGTVSGEPAPTKTWGLRWTALDSPLKHLGKLAVKYRQGIEHRDKLGDHYLLQQFTRDMLVEPYRGQIDPTERPRTISRQWLTDRSVTGWADSVMDRDSESDRYLWSRHLAPPPPGAEFADVAIDVQQDRIYWAVGFCDRDLRMWDACWGYEYASPTRDPLAKLELHALLDRVRDLVPDLVGGHPLIARCVDVGYRQEEIVEWMRANPDWVPIAGAGEDAAGQLRRANASGDVPGIVYRHRPEGWRLPGRKLHSVDAGRVRELAQNAFLRPVDAPAAAHLPRGLRINDSYIKHLCGELLVEDPKTGNKTWKATPGTRHDYLDLRVYRYAMVRLYLAQRARADDLPPRDPTAPPAATEAGVDQPPPPAAPAAPPPPAAASPSADDFLGGSPANGFFDGGGQGGDLFGGGLT